MKKNLKHIIKKAKSMSLSQDEKMSIKNRLEHHISKNLIIKKIITPSLSKTGISKKITKRKVKIVKKNQSKKN